MQLQLLHQQGERLKGFIRSVIGLALLVGCGACCGLGEAKRVKVSDFGYDPVDATAIIRKALDSGAKTVVFDRQKGPWYTESISLGSHVELVFEEGVELVAKKGGFVDMRHLRKRDACRD